MLCVPRTMLSQDVCPSVSLSVCLSICLSHAGILSKRFNISSHFFTFYRNIPTGTPITGPLNAGGMKKRNFRSISRSLYLRNDTRYSNSYYGTQIWNRSQSFQWHRFQLFWVTPNFTVKPLFDAGNSKTVRDPDSFNGILIRTCTCSTRACHFEWPWVILSDLVKYLMRRSIARSLCNSWASCSRHNVRIHMGINTM